jgi:uncharacterized damage-inducible protein DinB
MHTVYQAYLNRLEALHREIGQALNELPVEALDWTPIEDAPSICVLVTHLTGAERYWIGDVVGEDTSGRDREAEFQVRGSSASELMERMFKSREYIRHLIEQLDVKDLESLRVSSRDGKRYSVAWALLHALEHTAIHLGHIQIIRQLWDKCI